MTLKTWDGYIAGENPIPYSVGYDNDGNKFIEIPEFTLSDSEKDELEKNIIIIKQMELHTLLANFAQRNSMKYEDMLQKANRIIDGGFNELAGWGIQIEGGTRDEREESLRKELELKYGQ